MLLIFPPVAKPCEPPAGIAQLAGALRASNLPCTLLDANLEGLLFLLRSVQRPQDTWGRRAFRNLGPSLAALRSPGLYSNRSRYRRAVADVNRMLVQAGGRYDVSITLANYQDPSLSPLRSDDLLRAAAHPEKNPFYPYFAEGLRGLLAKEPSAPVGISLNYLSQAIATFAMIGFIRQVAPARPIILGGGLVTSWLSNPAWINPFQGLIGHLVAGPGEKALIRILNGQNDTKPYRPDFAGLPLHDYLAPGFILPYAASSGCYWNKCSFCPEKAEKNPYSAKPSGQVLEDIALLARQTNPVLLHFLDNALSPALLQNITDGPPGINWYGFARIRPELADAGYCRDLRASGCVMLKLGLESGSRDVLASMQKGLAPDLAASALTALKNAGIATYVYLLFGTPAESLTEARDTLDFVAAHAEAITFLNLAIFNLPVCSPDASALQLSPFSEGDLSIYTDFVHPRGWDRQTVRRFLDREFKRHPAVAAIQRRDPPYFTSNHAPFFIAAVEA